MKKTIYYLGNDIDRNDKIPKILIDSFIKRFPDINFIHLDPTENIPIPENKELVIIDRVKGIKKVTIFNNLNDFLVSPRNSVHDYDLYLDLQMLKKLGKAERIIIIGIPVSDNKLHYSMSLRGYKVAAAISKAIASLRSQ